MVAARRGGPARTHDHVPVPVRRVQPHVSAPTFGRPNFPRRSATSRPGVQLDLLPFGERALLHFLYLERPEGMERQDAEGFVPTAPPLEPLDASEAMLHGQEFATVGHSTLCRGGNRHGRSCTNAHPSSLAAARSSRTTPRWRTSPPPRPRPASPRTCRLTCWQSRVEATDHLIRLITPRRSPSRSAAGTGGLGRRLVRLARLPAGVRCQPMR